MIDQKTFNDISDNIAELAESVKGASPDEIKDETIAF